MMTTYAKPSLGWVLGIMPLWCLNTPTAMKLPLIVKSSLPGWPPARSSMVVFLHTLLGLLLMTCSD